MERLWHPLGVRDLQHCRGCRALLAGSRAQEGEEDKNNVCPFDTDRRGDERSEGRGVERGEQQVTLAFLGVLLVIWEHSELRTVSCIFVSIVNIIFNME